MTHNSFPVYGAENFAVFKDRPLSRSKAGGPKAVVHNGKLALLQQLDEQSLGLEYEGNDFFEQQEVPIQYYALRGQNEWRHQIYNRDKILDISDASRSSWFSQEEVVDHLAMAQKGAYAIFVVHPVYYGMRADEYSAPPIDVEAPVNLESSPLDWPGFAPSKTILRHTTSGAETEGQSVVVTNELGMTDVPLNFVRGAETKIVFLGKDQISTDRISVESKVPQALARILRRVHQKDVGATSLAAPFAPLSARLSWLEQLHEDSSFHTVVLSVGLSDLVAEDPNALARIWGIEEQVEKGIGEKFDVQNAATVMSGPKIVGAKMPNLATVDFDALKFAVAKEDSLKSHPAWDIVSRRLRQSVFNLKAKGYKVVLFLEDCSVSHWTIGTASAEDCSVEDDDSNIIVGTAFAELAADIGVSFVNPYLAFSTYEGMFATKWRSSAQWSIHAHTLAARALASQFLDSDLFAGADE